MSEKSKMNAYKQPSNPGMSINKIKMVNYVAEILYASNNPNTRQLIRQLNCCGLQGKLASQLFAAQKAMKAACLSHQDAAACKGSDTDKSPERMQKPLLETSLWLNFNAMKYKIRWGWCENSNRGDFHWVLAIDLPTSKVGFKSSKRMVGPDHIVDSDSVRDSENRIIEFCADTLIAGKPRGIPPLTEDEQ